MVSYFDRFKFYNFEDDESINRMGGFQILMSKVRREHRKALEQFKDKELALQIYKDFNEDIKSSILEDQLLVYQIKDGWAPLCDFLNVPVPDAAFPYKNKRKEFKEQIAQMMNTGGDLKLK